MLKIRRRLGPLIFNMGIAIPGKTVFLIETAPRMQCARWFNFLTTWLSRHINLNVCAIYVVSFFSCRKHIKSFAWINRELTRYCRVHAVHAPISAYSRMPISTVNIALRTYSCEIQSPLRFVVVIVVLYTVSGYIGPAVNETDCYNSITRNNIWRVQKKCWVSCGK